MRLLRDVEITDLRIAACHRKRPFVVVRVVDGGCENRAFPIEENRRSQFPTTAIVLKVSKPPPNRDLTSTSKCSVWTTLLSETVHWRSSSTSIFAWAGLTLKAQ